TEQERQQIFLLESQRLDFEKQIDVIDGEKDPALKLDKNKLLLQKRDQQEKLNSILAEEKKLESSVSFSYTGVYSLIMFFTVQSARRLVAFRSTIALIKGNSSQWPESLR
ncbi:MAG: hypothetical protein NTW61_01155, partial [Candidatus Melainabacteria bacterium]|nr:hypothetical protein [Candidatus Melainabacteria bacterium]